MFFNQIAIVLAGVKSCLDKENGFAFAFCRLKRSRDKINDAKVCEWRARKVRKQRLCNRKSGGIGKVAS